MWQMDIDTKTIDTVETTVAIIRRKKRSRAPVGFEWDDLKQQAYVRILKDKTFDPSKSDITQRVIAQVWYAYYELKNTQNGDLPIDTQDSKEFVTWKDEHSSCIPNYHIESPVDPHYPDSLVELESIDYLESLDPEAQEFLRICRTEPLPPKNSPARNRRLRRLRSMISEYLK